MFGKILFGLMSILFIAGLALAAGPNAPGTLLPVDVKVQTQVTAVVGDLVQLSIPFGVNPEQMITELEVQATGAVTKVAVVSVPKRAPNGKVIMGVSEIASFLRAEKAGKATVKLKTNDKAKSSYTVTIDVQPQTD